MLGGSIRAAACLLLVASTQAAFASSASTERWIIAAPIKPLVREEIHGDIRTSFVALDASRIELRRLENVGTGADSVRIDIFMPVISIRF